MKSCFKPERSFLLAWRALEVVLSLLSVSDNSIACSTITTGLPDQWHTN